MATRMLMRVGRFSLLFQMTNNKATIRKKFQTKKIIRNIKNVIIFKVPKKKNKKQNSIVIGFGQQSGADGKAKCGCWKSRKREQFLYCCTFSRKKIVPFFFCFTVSSPDEWTTSVANNRSQFFFPF